MPTSPTKAFRPTLARKRVLVTGGSGFVGANLVRRLLEDGHEVGVLLSPSRSSWRLLDVAHQIQMLETSLDDPSALSSLIKNFRPQWIFHLAAFGSYPWQQDPNLILRTNILGTANLLTACLTTGFEAFINTGSSSEYGRKDHAPDEDEILRPDSPYAISKMAATLYCSQQAIAHNAPILTLRLYSVYGPYEDPKRFIPQLIVHALQGLLPPLTDPSTARDFVYAEDVAEALVRATQIPLQTSFLPGNIYNVGTGVQTTLREAVECAQHTLGVKALPVWGSMKDHPWDTPTWVANIARLQSDFGWIPPTTFAQGLAKSAQWLRQSPPTISSLYTPSA